MIYSMGDNKKIVTMEDIIENKSKTNVNLEKVSNKTATKGKPATVVKGKPKSGRFWKSEKKRFSSIIKTKGIKKPFQKNQELRQKMKHIKELSNSIKAAKEEENEKRKQRRRENLKRQEENQRKSEVVQVITNTKKIKKMKKKHLRNVEKRDTTVIS